jgi:DNA helicase-2/ATP-dependent DNA helicase PcrA
MFDDDREEARAVAQEIKWLKERGKLASWKDAAILYRMNAQSRSLEEQLRCLGVPYVVIGSRSFYDRKEMKDVLAYFRLLYNQNDDAAFLRVVNEPARGIGEASLKKVRAWAGQQQWSLYEAAGQIWNCPGLRSEAKRAIQQFFELIAELRREAARLSLPELFDAVLQKSGYQEELERPQEGDIDRKGNVEELRRVALEYAEEENDPLEAFLEHTALLGGTENEQTGANGKLAQEAIDAVRCMSIHASKGLEFTAVWVIGMTEGCLPHSRAMTEEEMAEECRLAYVAATRAQKRLHLYGATRRLVQGEWRESAGSRFLDDLPAPFVQKRKNGQGWQDSPMRDVSS